jgi:hypothetical protein
MPPDSSAQPGAPLTQEGSALPSIQTAGVPQEVRERLATASRRGRLAGFDAAPSDGSLFAASAHGHPFDSTLLARLEGGRLTFRLVMLRRMPMIFAAILLFTIWPGVYFMDEIVAQFLPGFWRPWVTYYWYLPITSLPIPWMWRSTMARSRRSAREHACETIESIAKEIGGTIV